MDHTRYRTRGRTAQRASCGDRVSVGRHQAIVDVATRHLRTRLRHPLHPLPTPARRPQPTRPHRTDPHQPARSSRRSARTRLVRRSRRPRDQPRRRPRHTRPRTRQPHDEQPGRGRHTNPATTTVSAGPRRLPPPPSTLVTPTVNTCTHHRLPSVLPRPLTRLTRPLAPGFKLIRLHQNMPLSFADDDEITWSTSQCSTTLPSSSNRKMSIPA